MIQAYTEGHASVKLQPAVSNCGEAKINLSQFCKESEYRNMKNYSLQLIFFSFYMHGNTHIYIILKNYTYFLYINDEYD